MDEYLLLGYIAGSFGLDGTVKILSKTHFSEKRYVPGNEVFIYDSKDNSRITAKVESYRNSGQFDFVKFDIINTKEEADSFKNREVQIVKDNSELEVGYYYFTDLEACEVYDENNNFLGKVQEVIEFPAQNNLKIKSTDGKIFMVPFVKFFIKNVDIKSKKITIHLIEGML